MLRLSQAVADASHALGVLGSHSAAARVAGATMNVHAMQWCDGECRAACRKCAVYATRCCVPRSSHARRAPPCPAAASIHRCSTQADIVTPGSGEEWSYQGSVGCCAVCRSANSASRRCCGCHGECWHLVLLARRGERPPAQALTGVYGTRRYLCSCGEQLSTRSPPSQARLRLEAPSAPILTAAQVAKAQYIASKTCRAQLPATAHAYAQEDVCIPFPTLGWAPKRGDEFTVGTSALRARFGQTKRKQWDSRARRRQKERVDSMNGILGGSVVSLW